MAQNTNLKQSRMVTPLNISLFHLMATMMVVILFCIVPSRQQGSVLFNYYPNEGKLFSSDSNFRNVLGIQGGYCSALLSKYEEFGSLAFCYSDSAGLTIILGYGFSFDGIKSNVDKFGRFVRVEVFGSVDVSVSLDILSFNPSTNSYLIASAIPSNLPGVQFEYSLTSSDNRVNQFLKNRHQSQNPIVFIPLTEVTGTSLDLKVSVNSTGSFDLERTGSASLSNISYNRRTSYLYPKSTYKCVDYNCFIDTIVNETSVDNMAIRYYSDGNLLPNYNNFQLAKFTPELFPISSNLVTLKTLFTTTESFNSVIDTSSFSLFTGYYLKNGDKVHSQTQPITIVLESRDTNAFPFEAITLLTWSLSSTSLDLSRFSNNRFLSLPANIFTKNVEIIATIGFVDGTQIPISTFLYIENIGSISVMMDAPSPYITSGAVVEITTYVNVAPSLVQSVSYDNTAIEYVNTTSAFDTSSVIRARLYADAPGSFRSMQTIKLVSGLVLYNYISTIINPRYPLIAGCNILPNYGVAYEDMYGISCPMAMDESKISSIRAEVYQGDEKLFTLFNTKKANFATRLPLTLSGKNYYLSITITDNFGYSQSTSTSITFSASINPNYPSTLLGKIEKIQFFIGQTKARNYQTATNYAILLNMVTNGMLVGATSTSISQYSLQWNYILDYFITELDILRKTIFHNSVYDRAVPLLAPLLREIVDFSDKVSAYSTIMSSRKQVLIQNAEFLLSNDKNNWLSKRDRATIQRILGSFTMSDQLSFWNVTTFNDISDFNGAFESQINKLGSLFNRGMNLTTFGFKKQVNNFASLNDIASVKRSLSGLMIQMPGLTLNDYGYPSNNYSLSMTTYDISFQTSSKKFYLGVGNFSRFCGNTLFTIDVARSDGSVLSVSGLSSPIILTMGLTLDSELASSIHNINFTCRYLNTTSNTWSTSGVVTDSVSIIGSSVHVICKTNHLSTFTVFADDVFSNSTSSSSDSNPPNIPVTVPNVTVSNSLSKVQQAGLSQGVIAAIVVIPVVFVIVLIFAIVGVVLCLSYRMKKKKISSDPGLPKKNTLPIANAYKADTVQYDDLKIEMSSNLFISDYKSLNSNTAPTSPSTQSAESPVSYNVSTPSNTNVISKKYEILEKIGAGGFGSVFRARNLFFNHASKTVNDLEYYAIKKIQLSGLSELNDKFKEAVNMFKIRHENLVSLEDAVVDESTNSLYLVMKFYANGDLDRFVKTKKMPSEYLLKQIIIQVCRGLKYLEEDRGLIHRDIKPSNLFVDSYDPERDMIKVVVSDFGLAKESNMMSSVSFAGTPFFMNPQALIGSKYSFNADIFSLGCSIFLMITHNTSSSIAQLYFQKSGNHAQVHEFIRENIQKACMNSGVMNYSDEFIKVLLKMLEFDGDTRPNAAKVLEMIENTVEITTV